MSEPSRLLRAALREYVQRQSETAQRAREAAHRARGAEAARAHYRRAREAEQRIGDATRILRSTEPETGVLDALESELDRI